MLSRKPQAGAVPSDSFAAPTCASTERAAARDDGQRRAMELCILGQVWWAPYWSVADLWTPGSLLHRPGHER